MELMERRRILLNTPHINIVTGSQFVTDMVAPIESLAINFSPIQDLHGYDSPWPAGGGKNKFGLKQWLDSLNITYTQQGEKFTITSNVSLYTKPWVFSDTDVQVKFSCKSFTSETATRVRITFLDTGGNVVSSRYADDVLTLNVTASKCRFDWMGGGTFSIEEAQIELGSTTTSYAPYSNICPISGRTGLDVTITGKNLFDGILELGFINGTTGLDGVSNSYIRGKDYIPVEELTDYKFSTNNANITAVFVYEYKADKSYNLTTNKRIDLSSYLTTDANTAYIRFRPGYQTTDTSIKFQVEEGTVATAYEPYQGTTYPISWQTEAGTVYGGTLNVTTGVLTVDRAVYTFDGTEGFALVSNTQVETFNYFRWYSTAFLNVMPNWASINSAIMSCYPVQNQVAFWYSGGIGKDSVAWTVKNYAGLCIKDSRYSTAEELKTSLIGQTIAYELATPQTYQLTPQQILALKGINNLSMPGQVKFWTHRDIQ